MKAFFRPSIYFYDNPRVPKGRKGRPVEVVRESADKNSTSRERERDRNRHHISNLFTFQKMYINAIMFVISMSEYENSIKKDFQTNI